MKRAISSFLGIVVCACSIAAQGWSWQQFTYDDQIWMRSYYNGAGVFDYAIGCGGSLERMRYCPDAYVSLLAPSFSGEATDRIFQWVSWGTGLHQSGTGAFDDRFNMNQGGDFNGGFNEIITIDTSSATIDIYALTVRQWFSQLTNHFSATIPSFTRYQMLPDNVLAVTFVLYCSTIQQNGTDVGPYDYYVENWSPFAAQSGYFNALVYSLNSDGSFGWWERFNANILAYKFRDVTTTEGYALVANEQNASSPCIALVFGKHALEITGTSASGTAVVNAMDWNQSANDRGIAILPGINLGKCEPGSIIKYNKYIVPNTVRDGAYKNKLDTLVAHQTPQQLFGPTITPPGELALIKARLKSILANSIRGEQTIQTAQCIGRKVDWKIPAPKANAENDRTLSAGSDSTLLDGSASTDPSGLPLSFTWAELTNNGAKIQTSTAAKTIINGLIDGMTCQLRLIVSNGYSADSCTVSITVKAPSVSISESKVVNGQDKSSPKQPAGSNRQNIYDLRGKLISGSNIPANSNSFSPLLTSGVYFYENAGKRSARRFLMTHNPR